MNINDPIPEFSERDETGIFVTNKDFVDHWTILYFYPKDGTPHCTNEACSFRDFHSEFLKQGVRIIGVSPDSAQSHRQFAEQNMLNFPLLCDENKNLAKKFKVLVAKEIDGKSVLEIERSTFIVNPEAKIAWKEQPVSVEGHTDRIMQALEQVKI